MESSSIRPFMFDLSTTLYGTYASTNRTRTHVKNGEEDDNLQSSCFMLEVHENAFRTNRNPARTLMERFCGAVLLQGFSAVK